NFPFVTISGEDQSPLLPVRVPYGTTVDLTLSSLGPPEDRVQFSVPAAYASVGPVTSTPYVSSTSTATLTGIRANTNDEVFTVSAKFDGASLDTYRNPPRFFVSPAPLTVTANDASKTYGDPDPALTFTHDSLAAGDSEAVFQGALSRAIG